MLEIGLITIEDIDRIIAEKDLWYVAVCDSELVRFIDGNKKAVQQYRQGNARAINAIVGQVMKQYRGAEASEVSARISELIEGA